MDKEKLAGYWGNTKEALGKVSKKIWILIAAVLVVLAAAVVVYFNTRPYATLITGATTDEFNTVVTWLDEQGFKDYRTEGSDTILVPQGQAVSLKAKLLQEQYSTSNSGWNAYFERVSALSTMRDRDEAKLITLMEDMEAVIRQFPGVRDADVKINTGEDNSYILDSNKVVNATAAVMLTMENDKYLDDGQATAIRNYISKSVASLSVDEISIQDTRGNIYDEAMPDAASSDPAATSALKMQMERFWTNFYQNKVEQMLYKAYGGEEHVGVTVHLNVELGDKTINDYQVHLPDFAEDGSTNGEGIVSNKFYSWALRANNETVAGGVVGTPTNSELPIYVEEGNTIDELLGRLAAEGSVEYDNSKTQTQMVITAGTITDVSIAVMIDSNTLDGPLNVDEMRQFIASTVGINLPFSMEDMSAEEYDTWKNEYLGLKVGVWTTPFYREPEAPAEPTWTEQLQAWGIPTWAVFAAIGGLILFLLILVIVILLVRRGKKKKQEKEQRAVDEMLEQQAAQQMVLMQDADGNPLPVTMVMGPDGTPIPVTMVLGPDGNPMAIGPDGRPVENPVELDENGDPVTGANVMDLHTERSMELRQSIRDFVDENMEVAALLIKSWLKEDGDNG